ncbi:peptidoglycan/LPS O-acetylase OafA/YrhL [Pedobacter sp. AK017]|uniref:acyltransferase family protein n=1 Tax=Pedobacter sp. AK017 TaxID=2723073 RepID=UPI00161F8E2A|nr:acyltransferase [Pedobacter sp. AK017]MBB5441225.1 peptidoglycan/LPS O-acetylase OafA/YrhL [Pedobacter sp. AK017]
MKLVNHDTPKPKTHFEVLDGLRGIAAICVVTFHFIEMTISDYSKIFIGHSFLAVDFFFCLSGFVIAYAYDDRVEKLGVANFFKLRLIRLHPLVILGTLLGFLSLLFDPFVNQFKSLSSAEIISMFISSVFLVPFPVMIKRGLALFALNAPAWSLFWEYVANIFYAIYLCRISRRSLLALTILTSIFIGWVLFESGSLTGGWNKATFWDGGARVSYSFLAGILVYRSNWIIKNRLGFLGVATLLLLSFIMPFSKWNWITEPIVVLFYFPLLVALGAGTALKSGLKKLCNFFGNISYPLYMTHYSVIWVFAHYYKIYKPVTYINLIIAGGVIFLIGFAYLILLFYDIPLRKYLKAKIK